jgi:hypothetical protein
MRIHLSARKIANFAAGLVLVLVPILHARPAGADTTPSVFPEVRWHAGIINDGQAPLPGAIYAIENHWLGSVGRQNVGVYAGSYRHDASEGVVVVIAHSLDLMRTSRPAEYHTRGTGALRIVVVSGSHMVLATQTGRRLQFRVPGTLPLSARLGG